MKVIIQLDYEITNHVIDSSNDSILGHRLNRELYSLFTNIAQSKAWTAIKTTDQSRGLEALRLMFKATTQRGPAALQAEHRYLNNPTHKRKHAADLQQWIAEWEHRIASLEMISVDWRIPATQKRNVLYECLPPSVLPAVDNEMNTGNIIVFDALKSYVLTPGNQQTLLHQKGPAPMSLNHVTQDEGSQNSSPNSSASDHSPDEWLQWLQTVEGAEYA